MCSSLTSVTHSLPVRFKMEMGGDGKRERSQDKLPAGGMWLLPITAGICGVTYQGDGKYLTFNILTVR